MPIINAIIEELKQEAAGTRKTLERVPEDKFDWRPHARSFTMRDLAAHLSDVPNWLAPTMLQDELDFAGGKYVPFQATSTAAIVTHFDEGVAKGIEAMRNFPDDKMMIPWTLRSGDQIFFTMPRFVTLRSFVMNHLIHHRAQLGLYLRLNDIAVPAIYGPSADER